MNYDKIIIGAGLYGLYSALFCAKRGEKVLVLEHDSAPFKRATYINQARVHMGYHYPRSYSTAIKSAHYFERFMKDYSFCVLTEFDKIYATSSNFSWTNAEQFMKFCKAADIRCDDVNPSIYFKEGMCDGTFLTTEYTYDANILKKYFLNELKQYSNVEIKYDIRIKNINKNETSFEIALEDNQKYSTDFLLNATYASCNQILNKLEYEPFKIKYELCEIILCRVSDKLKNVGITVMDGPFFSIMPFGKTGYHSLTSVTFTPHMTSYESLPTFECQKRSNGFCSLERLGNCNDCPAKPESAWPYMSNMARKYLKDEYEFEYAGSLFSMKPILKASEIDDSRPTVIKQYSSNPTFVSVLSGKINTVYDLDEVLLNGNK
ncbi:NAD(P)-binding protein [Clostridium neonatale]|uniref:NAD(P)-binding protein n=1 Tax=Clostridium neonatale TaxID=137838 RepID=UPI003D355771